MAIIGYICITSQRQAFERHQEFEIEQFAKNQKLKIDKWIQETVSSHKIFRKRRTELLLDQLKEGDILITSEISQLGRSSLEVMPILEGCLDRNCQVWTIKENYRFGKTSTFHSIKSSFKQFNRRNQND